MNRLNFNAHRQYPKKTVVERSQFRYSLSKSSLVAHSEIYNILGYHNMA
jgi:hypothetical protein